MAELNGLAICAGVGGLELGLTFALGDRYRCVGYVERDAYAAATLVARMADASLDSAPIWDDIATFDGRPWRGIVDCLSAGFPCQPFSAAGKRRGLDDKRWLWPDIARVIREVQPRWVFLENVPGLIRRGLAAVLWDLADCGFAAEWDVFSAAEVGAPHLRKRLFLLAHAGCQRRQQDARGASGDESAHEGRAALGCHVAASRHADVADTEAARLEISRGRIGSGAACAGPEHDGESLADASDGLLPLAGRRPQGRERAGSTGAALVDAESERWREGRAESVMDGRRTAVAESSLPLWPPGPADADGWRNLLAAAPGLEPAVYRDADGIPNRLDRLRACGNGVVPLVAALAFCRLADRLGLDVTALAAETVA